MNTQYNILTPPEYEKQLKAAGKTITEVICADTMGQKFYIYSFVQEKYPIVQIGKAILFPDFGTIWFSKDLVLPQGYKSTSERDLVEALAKNLNRAVLDSIQKWLSDNLKI